MKNIFCYYNIVNPPEFYRPNDEISGVFYIENKGKKEKKLKKIEIRLYEVYQEYKVKNTTTKKFVRVGGEVTIVKVPETTASWVNRSKSLIKYKKKPKEIIKPGEIKEFPFKFKLPSTWSPKISQTFKDWHFALVFRKKTGLKTNLGATPNTAYYVLPIQKSVRPPSVSNTFQRKESESGKLVSIESEKSNKLTKLFNISSKVKIDDISNILNVQRSNLMDKLIDLSDRVSFEIEGDFLIVDENFLSKFLVELGKEFNL